MRSLNSSHVVGAVSGVHGICGLLPSAGQFVVFDPCVFPVLVVGFVRDVGDVQGSGSSAMCGLGALDGLRWCENRFCETPGDALSKFNLDMNGQGLLFQLEERRMSLFGGAPGWCESLLLLFFSPGRCFPGFLCSSQWSCDKGKFKKQRSLSVCML